MQAKPKRCRKCGTTEPRRFGGLARAECDACKAARLAARVARPTTSKMERVRPDERSHPEHLAWIRTLTCTIRRCTAQAPQHAHHVRTRTGGGMGMKPDDRWTVPLCGKHHGEGHQAGWQTFEAKYGVDLRRHAERLAALSPALTGGPEPV